MLNVIISHAWKKVVDKFVVVKLVMKKKFLQIRGKQRTGGAKLLFRLMLSAHPSVFNVLSVNFTIIRIYKVMLHSRPTHRILIYIYIWLHYLVKLIYIN